MENLLQELSKPAWWLSTVIAALAINLLSSYVKSWLDKSAARFWKSRREKSQHEEERWKKTVSLMSTDYEVWAAFALKEMRDRWHALFNLIFAMFSLLLLIVLIMARKVEGETFPLIYRIPFLAAGAFLFYVAATRYLSAERLAVQLHSAFRMRKIQRHGVPEKPGSVRD